MQYATKQLLIHLNNVDGFFLLIIIRLGQIL